jgi:glycosyltransferase involved in cell wall biosynthesis
MKTLHLVAGIDPKSGGPTRSISGLCHGLAGCGVDTHLFSASTSHNLLNASSVKFYKGSGRGLMKIRSDAERIIREIAPDIIHLHGLWMPVNHVFCGLTHRHDIPFVQSVRGMLDPWALKQRALKKRIALLTYQRSDLNLATCLHATADQERRNIRAQGFLQPIIVIPNGVDLPALMPLGTNRSDGRKTALFLSRLHPGKGLLDLVRAWAICRPSGWVVRVVGPDVCGHKAHVVNEVTKRGLQNDFEFVGELSDSEKWQEYVNADLFVHPSHSENFGISIAEALAAGVPVITTKGTPWAELLGYFDHSVVATGSVKADNGRCGWWIDIGVEPLAEALREAMGLSDEDRRTMGENGRKLVDAKYTWPAIAEQMKSAYAWILEGGDTPPYVRL